MTNLVYLAELTGPQTIATNEDWTGALTFWWDDARTVPVALDGIDFVMTARAGADDPNVLAQLSTDDGTLSLLAAGVVPTIEPGGSDFAVGDLAALQGGTCTKPAVIKVTGAVAGLPTAVALVSAGSYSVLPANPVTTVALGGSGIGLTLALAWVNNALCVTVPKAEFPDTLGPGSFVYEIRGTDGVNTEIVASGPLTVTRGVVRP